MTLNNKITTITAISILYYYEIGRNNSIRDQSQKVETNLGKTNTSLGLSEHTIKVDTPS